MKLIHYLASLIEQYRRSRPDKSDRETFWYKELALRVGTLSFEEIAAAEKSVREQI